LTNIVSYAQCAEDLVLWGALGDVPKGFYIDVGAADPNHESVTRLFYEHGWSGVNIEPRANGFAAFPLARPRDVNLQIAVSNKSGMFTLHEVIDHVYLTTMVDNFAKNYEANGMACRSYEVPCRTLASVCEEHVHSDIHFLKIDVEGAELSALEGCDYFGGRSRLSHQNRPRVHHLRNQ